jgi:energy-coupling factor transporter ATP-binding protein EcfA2
MLVSAHRPKSPYPGLRPFEPEEWSIFFGRETMVDDVIERLAARRVVLIHGASGSGKSSLVKAGVMPRLARQHLRHGIKWVTSAMRPSGGPLWNLAHDFARLEGRAKDRDRVVDIIRLFNRQGATLSSVVNSLEVSQDVHLFILVDQFEELFRFERETSREEAELFIELLVGEISNDRNDDPNRAQPVREPRVQLAITMRSEFLGECARFNGFAEAINRTQYLVPRLRYEALLRAIQRPAELYGGEVTLELAESLIADVRGREDELPLIQHGLMLLWNAAMNAAPNEPVRLDVEKFRHGGGLTRLLSDHADRVMTAVSPSEDSTHAVERLFRSLTDISSDGRAIRRPQPFAALVNICESSSAAALSGIIDAFRADGVSLLTPYFPAEIGDKTVIDISHEALIRCWDRIANGQKGWLRLEFQDGLIWRSLLNDAEEFETDRKHILSPAATTQRIRWFGERNPAWSERYGGGWELVAKLLLTSRRMAVRSTRLRRLFITPITFFIIMMSLDWDRNALLLLGSIASIYVFLLAVLLIVDFSQQLIPSQNVRTIIVWSTFLITSLAYLMTQLFSISSSISDTVKLLFSLGVIMAVVWVATTAGSFLLDRIPPRWIPYRLLRLLGIEPAVRLRRRPHLAEAVFDN